MMEYEQLERCYKTVLKQRNEAETKVVDLECKLDDVLSDIIACDCMGEVSKVLRQHGIS